MKDQKLCYLNLVEALTSESDETFRQKPYACLDGGLNFNKADISLPGYLFESCEERDIWPLEALNQVLSSRRLADSIDYITDCGDRSRFDPPRTLDELRSEKYAYFAGVAAGDGGFNGGNLWSVVDGGKDHELDASREYIQQMMELIEDLFGISTQQITYMERGNRIELRINNKWFARFLTECLELPESYKKGKLSKPDFFDTEETRRAFWRGVFDTDGSIAKNSYRVSMASATEEFADQCREDLSDLGIKTRKDCRPEAYHIRIPGKYFGLFCDNIGFSHLRKKRIMISKLRKGSRNYTFCGRNQDSILAGRYFDLTKMNRLRVKGLGNRISEYREKNDLFQKDLAEILDVSQNQVYYWEKNEYAAPINELKNLFNTKQEYLEFLSSNDLQYKVGVRGRGASLIKLPVEASKEVDNIASGLISSKNELRIKNKHKETAERVEDEFRVKLKRKESKFFSTNRTLVEFFNQFYDYKREFAKRNNEEIEKLREQVRIL